MDQGVLQLLKTKQSSVAVAGLGTTRNVFSFLFGSFFDVLTTPCHAGIALPPVTERNGAIDLGIPADLSRVVAKREDGRKGEASPQSKRLLSPEEQEVISSLVGELDRQEADHMELASACSRVIDAFEASMSRIDADQALRTQMGTDPPGVFGGQWGSETMPGGARGKQQREEQEEEDEEEEEVRKKSRTTGALPKESVTVLKEWLFSHVENPYPTQVRKTEEICVE